MGKNSDGIIKRYFRGFGIRQCCDLLMLCGAVALIVGLFTTETVVAVGAAIYIAACLLAVLRVVMIFNTKPNRRSPEFRRALVNLVIMLALLAVAVFTLVYAIMLP